MRKGFWVLGSLLALGLIGSDAMGACPLSGGGGMRGGGRGSVVSGRRGVTKDGRNKIKRPVGGSSKGSGGGCGAGATNKQFRKWSLPASVDVADLNTAVFDGARTSLRLNDEQKFRIEKASKEINAERGRLLKEQSEARGQYSRANGYNECFAAARRVMSATKSCQRFDPTARFNKALFALLTDRQQDKYKALLRKNS